MEDRITVEIQGGVADVRLVRVDKMNALDDAMFEALIKTGERLKTEAGVRAVVLSGAGRAFCAGLDMGNFDKMASGERKGGSETLVTADRTPGGSNRAQHAVMVWREIPVPVIAAIHGVAFGGGFQIIDEMRERWPGTPIVITSGFTEEIEAGLRERTLIIFTSDNGPHRENGGDPAFFKSSGIYRGIKRDLYEGGMRVPFIAYWPTKIKPAVVTQPAALWDMYPTFLELAKIPVTEKIDGISIVPLLTKNKGKQKLHDFFYWEFHENDGRQAVRWGKWKGVRLGVSKNENAPIELYNLNTDPSEQTNLAAKYPSVVKVMEQLMKQEHVYNPDWPLLSSEKNK
mgnify:CR=1 FL=1